MGNMASERISNRQLFFILVIMRTTIVISFLPVLTSADALQDAWLSAIFSYFGGALMVLVIVGLAIQYPKETVIQYSQNLLGPWFGKCISLIILFSFLYIAATDARMYAEVISIAFLMESPLSFTLFGIISVSALAAYCGLESIGRAADFLFPLFLLMVVSLLFIPIPQMTYGLDNLEPLLARGMGPILRGAITPISITLQFLILTIVVPSLDKPQKALSTALWALGFSTIFLVIISVIVIAILGPSPGSRIFFPFLNMIRALRLSEYLERIEPLLMFAWGFGVFIGVATFMFCGAKGLAQLMGLKCYRPLIIPMTVIWITLSLHGYRNIFQLRDFFHFRIIGPFVFIFLFLTPFGSLWIGNLYRSLKG